MSTAAAITVSYTHLVGLDLEDEAAELLAARLDQLTALRVLARQEGGVKERKNPFGYFYCGKMRGRNFRDMLINFN